MTRWMFAAAAAAALATTAWAKLPPPDEAAKAKAAEAAAKSAWQGKVDAYKVCQAQDRIAARYKSNHPAQAKAGAAQAASAAQPASAAQAAAKPPTPTAATASQGGGTPVAAVNPAPAIPGCADPGPFAYAPPEQKPLESSGAHSPAANATSPPSVRAESGTMTSGKTGAAPAPAKK